MTMTIASTAQYLVTITKAGKTWDEYFTPAPAVLDFDDIDELLVFAAKDKHGAATFCRVKLDQHGKRVRRAPTVWVQGYEFFVEYAWLHADGAIYFAGTCTPDPRNDSIRHTGYNGGTYRFSGPILCPIA